jgi:histidine kinase 2/3/4 (cytokinin receptor)
VADYIHFGFLCLRYIGGAFDVETLVENLLREFPGSEIIAVNVYDITNELCPLVMYGHTNVSKSENTYVSPLDFGDPLRKHEMRCRWVPILHSSWMNCLSNLLLPLPLYYSVAFFCLHKFLIL